MTNWIEGNDSECEDETPCEMCGSRHGPFFQEGELTICKKCADWLDTEPGNIFEGR